MTDLSIWLGARGQVPMIGAERGREIRDGIAIWRSSIQPGSHRYLFFEHGEPLAVLQIVGERGSSGRIANVFTRPDARRRGLATVLLDRARRDFSEIEHSSFLSDDGLAWAQSDRRRQSALARRLTHP